MLKISEIAKKTEEMFDRFNAHFYSSKLTRQHTIFWHPFRRKKRPTTLGLIVIRN